MAFLDGFLASALLFSGLTVLACSLALLALAPWLER